MIDTKTPSPEVMAAIVRGTRRPLSYFVDKTAVGLKAIGFLQCQIGYVRAAMAAAGLAFHDNELLTPVEWSAGRTWGKTSYFDIAQAYRGNETIEKLGLPPDVAREIKELNEMMNQQTWDAGKR